MKHLARFWSRVDKSSGCWLWTGAVGSHGYGQIQAGARSRSGHRTPTLTHRLSWEIANGPIQKGLFVLHRCDTRRCVNPEHLFLGTNADNMRDMNEKGRDYRGPTVTGAMGRSFKLKPPSVLEIRRRISAGETQRSIAHNFGVSQSMVYRIGKGLVWRDLADESKKQWHEKTRRQLAAVEGELQFRGLPRGGE